MSANMDPIRSCTYEYEYEYGIESYNPIQSFPRILGLEYEKVFFDISTETSIFFYGSSYL